jgi:acyl-coenzyme A synthetase/AMP-(fatty) acid ligase
VMGGEAFSGELVNRWNDPPRRFVNGYGPTEAAVGCIFYECEHRPWSTPPPIGRPMPGRTAYVLDANDQLCPVGVPGAIVVGGRGIARGYLNNAELTRERFDDDPYRSGGTMYRTGDLGVWTEDGQIQFLGRIDAQVKLNGLRIELEEIESALAAVPGVAAAAVAVGVSDRGSKHLVAYVVPENGPVDDGDLRAALAEELPAYMLPSSFVRLDALPLTPVGKIDRAALPSAGSGSDASAELVPPQTREERLVAAAFAEAVGVEEVGADSDFFALGGTSLDATSVASRLGELTKAEVPVRLLYMHPTVRRLATMLARGD